MMNVRDEIAASYSANQTQSYVDSEDAIIQQALEILDRRMSERFEPVSFTSPQAIKQHAKLKLGMLEHEEFHVYFLNNQHRLIKAEKMFTGTIDGAAVYPREIVKRALQLNAAALILVHNHPSGVREASQSDIAITKRIKEAVGTVDIRVLDHIIVASDEPVSFAERGLL